MTQQRLPLDLLRRYERNVPRYTSYPTAPHFHDGIHFTHYAQWLSALPDGAAVSLYFHIPFCSRMCWYCGCHTKVVQRYDPVAAYAETLAQEIDLVAKAVGDKALSVHHIHWGGGTPTMLSKEDLAKLMGLVADRFLLAKDAEVAIEIDPYTLTREQAFTLAEAGVNRASFGVQDFNPNIQEAINRVQSFEVTQQAAEWLREAGVQRFNFDLMYGLPYQTEEDVLNTVDLSVKMSPDRFAIFGYAHVPWMKTHQKMIKDETLPDGPQRLSQAEVAAERLMHHGFKRIGLDHFAAPDDEMARALHKGTLKRNFQGYTTDKADILIPFGASSIGSLPQGYVQNAVPFKQYADHIAAGHLTTAKGIALSDEDRLRRAIIERLMCDLTVKLNPLTEAFGPSSLGFEAAFEALTEMAGDGLVTLDQDQITITEKGRPLMRTVCALFDTYLASGAGRHSRAV